MKMRASANEKETKDTGYNQYSAATEQPYKRERPSVDRVVTLSHSGILVLIGAYPRLVPRDETVFLSLHR